MNKVRVLHSLSMRYARSSSMASTPPISCRRCHWFSSSNNEKTHHNDETDKDDPLTAWIPPDKSFDSTIIPPPSEEESDLRNQLASLERKMRAQEDRERGDERNEYGSDKISPVQTAPEEQIDWLQTRRAKLEGVDLMSPEQGTTKRHNETDLPVILHTLLSSTEIADCLTSMGGKDITIIPDKYDRMGGAKGMILVSASTLAQVKLLAETLVRQLKRRKLHEVGVIGAQLGAEGSDDKNDPWRLVNCENYIVQILEEETRQHLDLESLWGGDDASRHVNLMNEAEIDAYVEANPVPKGYGRTRDDWNAASIAQMKRNRFWIPPHQPVVSKAERKRMKRKKRRS
jgi:ribosomal silencing factor RsfS